MARTRSGRPENALLRDVLDAVETEIAAHAEPPRWLRALHDALQAVDDPGLAERFSTGRLDPPAAPGEAPAAPGNAPGDAPGDLDPEQRAAVAACVSPGLQLVWGPPATGKTTVIAHALAHLLASGRSALLVAGTAVAVDEALIETLRVAAAAGLDPAPGQLVRAGCPVLPEVAAHPWLPVAAARGGPLPRLAEVEREAAAWRADPALVELERAQASLHGFSPNSYKAARRRLANAATLAALRQALEERAAGLEAAQAEVAAAAAVAEEAEAAAGAVAEAQAAYRELDRLQAAVDELERARAGADAEVQARREAAGEAGRAVAELARLPLVERLRRRSERAELASRLREREAATAAARERAARLAADLDRARAAASAHAAAMEREARRHSRQQVEARLQAHELAQARLAEAQESERERERDWRAAKEEVQHAQQATLPEPDDYDLVERAERERLPELAAGLAALRRAAGPATEALERLDAERERLQAEAADLAGQVVGEAAVVAATLEELVTDPAARGRRYDFVLVDEAAFAPPPLVVHAATRATQGVTLLGDFLQAGPASAHQDQERPPAAAREWLLRDSFAILGIGRPEQALAAPGCVVLGRQRRFGQLVSDLANRVAYGGVLTPADDAGGPGRGGEVVVVDVGGAGVYRDARSGTRGWWPAGVLVARALAERHRRAGLEVGVLAPYPAERRLVEAALADAAVPLDQGGVDVGSAERFQGRSFPVVVFDTVEGRTAASGTPGLVASGRAGGNRYELEGLRLFDVALTRARQRLYVAVDGAALAAATDGPLCALQELAGAGRVRVVAAAELLPPAAAPLRGEELYARIEAWIARAERAVWVWSPAGEGLDELAGSLRAAIGRGVRVQVFVKPRHEYRRNTDEWLARIRSHGVGVVAVAKLQQRLVVVDQRVTFAGGHEPDGAPAMVLVEGRELARRVLDHELAAALADCPRCERHEGDWCEARYSHGRGPGRRGWWWHCPRAGCGWRRRVEG